LRWLLRVGVFTLILAASLLLSSSRLDWVMAWVYIGIYIAAQVVTALVLIPKSPELLAERAQSEGPRDLDRVLAGIMALFGPVAMWAVAGLDVRWEWSSLMPLALQVVALAIVMLGSLLTIWAMASNEFFYGVLRVEKDRGHTTATGGPYRYVRHPGYAGAIVFDLATPVALGSLWALLPAALTVCAIVVRTALEDKALREQLEGYKEYAQQTRYRLLPGIW
jgi:protein-S-isoprenylcysteine O-methyltransferase Ste14